MALSEAFQQAFKKLAAGDDTALEGFEGLSGQQLMNQNVQQKQQEEQEQEDNSIEGQIKKQQEEKEERQERKAEGLDALFGKIGQMNEDLMKFGGIDETIAHFQQEGVTGENIGRGIASLGKTIAAGFPMMITDPLAHGYEAITGKPVTESHTAEDGTVYMANEDLNETQRLAAGAQAGLMAAMPFTGGVGGAAKTAGIIAKDIGVKGAETTAKELAELGVKGTLALGKEAEQQAAKNIGDFAGRVAANTAEGAGFGIAGAYRGDQDTYSEENGGGPSNEQILQGAITGGAMGGGMGLVGQGFGMLNKKVIGEHINDNTKTESPETAKEIKSNDPNLITSETIQKDLNRPDEKSLTQGTQTDSFREWVAETERKNSEEPGGGTSWLQGNGDLKGRETELDVDDLASKMSMEPKLNDETNEEAAKYIADAFGIEDDKKLMKLAQEGEYDELHKIFNDAIAKKNENQETVDVLFYKNPAKKDEGNAKLNVVNITNNKSKRMATTQDIADILVLDYDGDEGTFSFNPKLLQNARNPYDTWTTSFGRAIKGDSVDHVSRNAFERNGTVDLDEVTKAYEKTFNDIGLSTERNEAGQTFNEYLQTRNTDLTKLRDGIVNTYKNKDTHADEWALQMEKFSGHLLNWAGENKRDEYVNNFLATDGLGRFNKFADDITFSDERIRSPRFKPYDNSKSDGVSYGYGAIFDETIGAISETEGFDVYNAIKGSPFFRELTTQKFSSKDAKGLLSKDGFQDVWTAYTKKCFTCYMSDGKKADHVVHQYKSTIRKFVEEQMKSDHPELFGDRNEIGPADFTKFIDALQEANDKIAPQARESFKELKLPDDFSKGIKDEVPQWKDFQVPEVVGENASFDKKIDLLSGYLLDSDFNYVINLEDKQWTLKNLVIDLEKELPEARITELNNKIESLGDTVAQLSKSWNDKERRVGANDLSQDRIVAQNLKQVSKIASLENISQLRNTKDLEVINRFASWLAKSCGDLACYREGLGICETFVKNSQIKEIFKAPTVDLMAQKIADVKAAIKFKYVFRDIQELLYECSENIKADKLNDAYISLMSAKEQIEKISLLSEQNRNWAMLKVSSELERRLKVPFTKPEALLEHKAQLADSMALLHTLMTVDKKSPSLKAKYEMLFTPELKRTDMNYERFVAQISGDYKKTFDEVGLSTRLRDSEKFMPMKNSSNAFMYVRERTNLRQSEQMWENLNAQSREYAPKIICSAFGNTEPKNNMNIQIVAFDKTLIPTGPGSEKASATAEASAYRLFMDYNAQRSQTGKAWINLLTQGNGVIRADELNECRTLIYQLLSDGNKKVNLIDKDGTVYVLNRKKMFEDANCKITGDGTPEEWKAFLDANPQYYDGLRDVSIGFGNPEDHSTISYNVSPENLATKMQKYTELYTNNRQDKAVELVQHIDNSTIGSVQEAKLQVLAADYYRVGKETNAEMNLQAMAKAQEGIIKIKRKAYTDILINKDKEEILAEILRPTIEDSMSQIASAQLSPKSNLRQVDNIKLMLNNLADDLNRDSMTYTIARYLLDGKIIKGSKLSNKEKTDILNHLSGKTSSTVRDGLENIVDIQKERFRQLNLLFQISQDIEFEGQELFSSIIERIFVPLRESNFVEIINKSGLKDKHKEELQRLFGKAKLAGFNSIEDAMNTLSTITDSKMNIARVDRNFFNKANNVESIINKLGNKKLEYNPKTGEVTGNLTSNTVNLINDYIETRNLNLQQIRNGGLPKDIVDGLKAEIQNKQDHAYETLLSDNYNSYLYDFNWMESGRKKSIQNIQETKRIMREYLDEIEKDVQEIQSSKSKFTDNDITNMLERIDSSDEMPVLNAYDTSSLTNAVSLVDQLSSADNAVAIGTTGTLTSEQLFGAYVLSKTGTQLKDRIILNSKKREDALAQFAESFYNWAFVNSWDKDTKTINTLDPSQISEFSNNRFNFEDVVLKHNLSVENRPEFTRAGLSKQQDNWINISSVSDLQKVWKTVNDNISSFMNEPIVLSSDFGAAARDFKHIAAYSNEPWILKIKKKLFTGENFQRSDLKCEEVPFLKRDNQQFSDPADMVNKLIDQVKEFSTSWRDTLQKNLLESKNELDAYPGTKTSASGTNVCIDTGVFDCTIPWIDLDYKAPDGSTKVIRISRKQLEDARSGGKALIDKDTGEPIDPSRVTSATVTSQDFYSLCSEMRKAAHEAWLKNPEATQEELLKASVDSINNPNNPVKRNVNDIIQENTPYHRYGYGSNLFYAERLNADLVDKLRGINPQNRHMNLRKSSFVDKSYQEHIWPGSSNDVKTYKHNQKELDNKLFPLNFANKIAETYYQRSSEAGLVNQVISRELKGDKYLSKVMSTKPEFLSDFKREYTSAGVATEINPRKINANGLALVDYPGLGAANWTRLIKDCNEYNNKLVVVGDRTINEFNKYLNKNYNKVDTPLQTRLKNGQQAFVYDTRSFNNYIDNTNRPEIKRFNRNDVNHVVVVDDHHYRGTKFEDSVFLKLNNDKYPDHLKYCVDVNAEYNIPSSAKRNIFAKDDFKVINNQQELRDVLNYYNQNKNRINDIIDTTWFKQDINKNVLKNQTEKYLMNGTPSNIGGVLSFNQIKAKSVIGICTYTDLQNNKRIMPIFWNGVDSPVYNGTIKIKGDKVIVEGLGNLKDVETYRRDANNREWIVTSFNSKTMSPEIASKATMQHTRFSPFLEESGLYPNLMAGAKFVSSRLPVGETLDKSSRIVDLYINSHLSPNVKWKNLSSIIEDYLKKGNTKLSKEQQSFLLRREQNLTPESQRCWTALLKEKQFENYIKSQLPNQLQNEKDELFKALFHSMAEMTRDGLSPYCFLNKEDFFITTGNLLQLEKYFGSFDEACKTFTTLCCLKEGGIKNASMIDRRGFSEQKGCWLTNNNYRLVDNTPEGQQIVHAKSYWVQNKSSEQSTTKSIAGGNGSWDRDQKIQTAVLGGDVDFRDLLNSYSDTMTRKNEPLYSTNVAELIKKADHEYMQDAGPRRISSTNGNFNVPFFHVGLTNTADGKRILGEYMRAQSENFGKLDIYSNKETGKLSMSDPEIQDRLVTSLHNIGQDATPENIMYYADVIKCVLGGNNTAEKIDGAATFYAFEDALRMTEEGFQQGKVPFMIGKDETPLWTTSMGDSSRIMTPAWNKGTIKFIAKVLEKDYQDIEKLISDGIDEQLESARLMANSNAQLKIIENAYDHSALSLGHSWDSRRDLTGARWNDDIARGKSFRNAIFEDGGGDVEAYNKLLEESNLRRKGLQERMRNQEQELITNDAAKNGSFLARRTSESSVTRNGLRTASTLSRFFGLLDPLITAQNVVDKKIGQTGSRLLLAFSGLEKRAGFEIDDSIIKKLAENPETTKFFDAWHTAMFNGDEDTFISRMASGRYKASQYLKQAQKGKTFIENSYNKVVRIATGEPAWAKERNELAIRLWLKTAAEDGLTILDEKISLPGIDRPVSKLEAMMGASAKNPEKILCAMFLGADNTGLFRGADITGRKAWNITLKGDLAQSNMMTRFFEEAAKENSFLDFMMCTFGNKYFRASTNTLGRSLNYVAPTSTLNYVAARLMQNDNIINALRNAKITPRGIKNWIGKEGNEAMLAAFKGDMEVLKGYNSIREALLVDAAHMTVPALATMLLGGAFFEPPEDPDKRVNYKEWTICGLRIGQNWWLDDILGVAAPLAAFWKSAEMGQPDINIFLKGMKEHLCNNPFLKIGDCITAVMEPDVQLEEAKKIADMYEDAPGGVPDSVTYALGSLPGMALSYGSQFITPAFMKDWERTMRQYEVSYNKVWATSPSGATTEKGEYGATQKTTFLDAQIRKVTRNNPILGALMDLLPTGSTTSYIGDKMPRQVYNDPQEIMFMKKYSVLDDSGKYKSPQEQNAIAAQIIAMLNSTDNMAELRASGFCLDSETKKYVADVMHDMYIYTKEDFTNKKNSGALEYYTLGNGDTGLGKQRYAEFYNTYQESLKYWQSIYRDKLCSTELNQPIQQYNRFNTTYAQDAKGNWYATGFREGIGGIISPLVYAPQETGKENDWASASALNGAPMYDQNGQAMRGMVAAPNSSSYTPSVDSWAKENTYSSNYGSTYGTSSRSGYSRGGSGGGSSRTSIHSTSPNVNITKPTTSRQANLRDTQYDYLRPNYEIKGSRAARTYNSF